MCELSLEKELSSVYFPLMYVFLLKKADSRSVSLSVTWVRGQRVRAITHRFSKEVYNKMSCHEGEENVRLFLRSPK